MTVKQLYDFLDDISCDFDTAPVIAEIDGKEVEILNVTVLKDLSNDGYVTIKMTEQPES